MFADARLLHGTVTVKVVGLSVDRPAARDVLCGLHWAWTVSAMRVYARAVGLGCARGGQVKSPRRPFGLLVIVSRHCPRVGPSGQARNPGGSERG